jgi:hypothetical protein
MPHSGIELSSKPDWAQCQLRYEAFWEGELLDRPLLQVTAPRSGMTARSTDLPADEAGLLRWFTDPELVLPRMAEQVAATYYGGDALPVVMPVSGNLVAILAAYLGCPYRIVPGSGSGWADPVIDNWATRQPLILDTSNPWWQATLRLLQAAADANEGRYLVAIPDLQGDGEIVALLRGTERLALDMVEHPDEVRQADNEVNLAWWEAWRECNRIIASDRQGYVDWLGVWSRLPAVTLECDFACMISTEMFKQVFLPGLERQASWVSRTIFHLDGPGALRHLETLLAIKELTGIQWVPGAGQPSMVEWLPLLQRIQAAGKRLVVACEDWEVPKLLDGLRPEGLLLSTQCATQAQAEALVASLACSRRKEI